MQDKQSSSCNLSANQSSYGDLTFYLDGAHTPESMEACVDWFSSAIKDNSPDYCAIQVEKLSENCGNHYNYNGFNKISKQVHNL